MAPHGFPCPISFRHDRTHYFLGVMVGSFGIDFRSEISPESHIAPFASVIFISRIKRKKKRGKICLLLGELPCNIRKLLTRSMIFPHKRHVLSGVLPGFSGGFHRVIFRSYGTTCFTDPRFHSSKR